MSELLKTGMDWLGDQMITHNSREVTYHRGNGSVTIRAMLDGSGPLKVDDGAGNFRIVRSDCDFIVKIADLVINSQSIEPQSGDKIHDTQDGQLWIYEVMAPGYLEPEAQRQEPYRKMVRIHAKRISVE